MSDYRIPEAEQDSVMFSFWTMLRECETTADKNNDPILKHWVTQWYQQWNRLTGDTHVTAWERRKELK